jgi:GNAT superfamily N-acetyltransferase
VPTEEKLAETEPAEAESMAAVATDASAPDSPPGEAELALREQDFQATLCDKRGEPFLVRVFRPVDKDVLHRFYKDFEPKREAHGLPPLHPKQLRSWVDTVLAKGFHLVAFREAELIGHAFVVPTEEPGIGEYAIFLKADSRLIGVGTAVNQVTVDIARKMGWQGLWLTVEPRNRAAVRSYEHVGFQFVRDAVLAREVEMRVDLRGASPNQVRAHGPGEVS